jgi:hypothetical protein
MHQVAWPNAWKTILYLFQQHFPTQVQLGNEDLFYLLKSLAALQILARYKYQESVSVAKDGPCNYFLCFRSGMAVRRRWRNDGSAGLAPFPFVGAGRGGGLGISAAYAQGTRAMFMERYRADLQRLMDREDLPADARWFDSHCHLDPWRSHKRMG